MSIFSRRNRRLMSFAGIGVLTLLLVSFFTNGGGHSAQKPSLQTVGNTPELSSTSRIVPTAQPQAKEVFEVVKRPDPVPPTLVPFMSLPEASLLWSEDLSFATVSHIAAADEGPLCASFEVVNRDVRIWTEGELPHSLVVHVDGWLMIVSEGLDFRVDIPYKAWHHYSAAQPVVHPSHMQNSYERCVTWAEERYDRTTAAHLKSKIVVIPQSSPIYEMK